MERLSRRRQRLVFPVHEHPHHVAVSAAEFECAAVSILKLMNVVGVNVAHGVVPSPNVDRLLGRSNGTTAPANHSGVNTPNGAYHRFHFHHLSPLLKQTLFTHNFSSRARTRIVLVRGLQQPSSKTHRAAPMGAHLGLRLEDRNVAVSDPSQILRQKRTHSKRSTFVPQYLFCHKPNIN